MMWWYWCILVHLLHLVYLSQFVDGSTCASGYAQTNVNGAKVCTPCVAGTYAISGATSCSLCDVNTYSASQAPSCTPCPMFSTASIGQTTCVCDNYHVTFGIASTLICAEYPTSQPTTAPTNQPSGQPSRKPSGQPTRQPTTQPIARPSSKPTLQPSSSPTQRPSAQPSSSPSTQPTSSPSSRPSCQPSTSPSSQPSSQPTTTPTRQPTSQPSSQPTAAPTTLPTSQPSGSPSSKPTLANLPTSNPTFAPLLPSGRPSVQPSSQPSASPSSQPSRKPTAAPSSSEPTCYPTSSAPSTSYPSSFPTRQPSSQPTASPSVTPTSQPTGQPTRLPTGCPSSQPTTSPTARPTVNPTAGVIVISSVPQREKYLATIASTIVITILVFGFSVGYFLMWYRRYKKSNKELAVYIMYGEGPYPEDDNADTLDDDEAKEEDMFDENGELIPRPIPKIEEDPIVEAEANAKAARAFTTITTTSGRAPGGWSIEQFDYEEEVDETDTAYQLLFKANEMIVETDANALTQPQNEISYLNYGEVNHLQSEFQHMEESCIESNSDQLEMSGAVIDLSSMENGLLGATSSSERLIDNNENESIVDDYIDEAEYENVPLSPNEGLMALALGEEDEEFLYEEGDYQESHQNSRPQSAQIMGFDDSQALVVATDNNALSPIRPNSAAGDNDLILDTPCDAIVQTKPKEKRTRKQQVEMIFQQTLKTLGGMKFANVSEIISPYTKKTAIIQPVIDPNSQQVKPRPASALDPKGDIITGTPPVLQRSISASPYKIHQSLEEAVVADIKNQRKYISFSEKYKPDSKVVRPTTPAITSIIVAKTPVSKTGTEISAGASNNSLPRNTSQVALYTVKQPPIVPAMANTIAAPAASIHKLPTRESTVLNTAIIVVKPGMWALSGVQYIITAALSANEMRITHKITYTPKQMKNWRLVESCFSQVSHYASLPALDWAHLPLTYDERNAFMANDFSERGESWQDAINRRAIVPASEVMGLLEIESHEEFYAKVLEADANGHSQRVSKGLHFTKFYVPFPEPMMTEEMRQRERLELETAKAEALARAESGWASIHMISEQILTDGQVPVEVSQNAMENTTAQVMDSDGNVISNPPVVGGTQAMELSTNADGRVSEPNPLAHTGELVPVQPIVPDAGSNIPSSPAPNPFSPEVDLTLPVYTPTQRIKPSTSSPSNSPPQPVRMRWVYVPNAYFGDMREQFLSENAAVCVLGVEWNGAKLSWTSFMESVIGDRDPSQASQQSIRGAVFGDWQSLGLATPPNLRDNVVHASTSAFQAMLDRLCWKRNAALTADPFFELMAATTERPFVIQKWVLNPIVEVDYKIAETELGLELTKGRDINSLDASSSREPSFAEDEDEDDVDDIGLDESADDIHENKYYKRVFDWFDRKDPNQVMQIAQYLIRKVDEQNQRVKAMERVRNSMVVQTYRLPTVYGSPEGASGGGHSAEKKIQVIQERRSTSMESGLILIKPTIVRSFAAMERIKYVLRHRGIKIVKQMEFTAEEMLTRNLFEKQFQRVWRMGTEVRPQSINLTSMESAHFEAVFGVNYRVVVNNRRVFNATSARTVLGITPDELNIRWSTALVHRVNKGLSIARLALPQSNNSSTNSSASNQKASSLTKPQANPKSANSNDLNVGIDIENTIFVINGFVGSMRDQFLRENSTICVLGVEWNGAKLSWGSFMESVIGDRDPEHASRQSIRGIFCDEYNKLGLDRAPTLLDNVVHASASALEALADRTIWFDGTLVFTDLFGSRLLAQRFTNKDIQFWLTNPLVNTESLKVDATATSALVKFGGSPARPTSAALNASRPTSALNSSRPTSALNSSRPTSALNSSRPTSALNSSRPTSALNSSRPTSALNSSRPTSATLSSSRPNSALNASRPASAGYTSSKTGKSNKVVLTAEEQAAIKVAEKESQLNHFLAAYPPVKLGKWTASRYTPADLVRPKTVHERESGVGDSDDDDGAFDDNLADSNANSMYEVVSVPLFTVIRGFGTEECLDYLTAYLERREYDRIHNPHLIAGDAAKGKRAKAVMENMMF